MIESQDNLVIRIRTGHVVAEAGSIETIANQCVVRRRHGIYLSAGRWTQGAEVSQCKQINGRCLAVRTGVAE